ncbi:MAG: U32 family peptidase C-terminal domain-containing protein [Candidatus Moranbacteria bacterium]|jgi:putative protease|nr:U32 family peptidase C-terminal domain-containing protein [Candidatus Moranbacteria bacterium]
MKKRTIELLAPAGSLDKMQYALHYGADAVYAGVPDFSLRARINNFDFESLKKGADLAHSLGKKFYVTLNIYAHNIHLSKLEGHLKKLKKIEIDGIILSDPGILLLVKKYLPKVEIHLSTQANATNWQAVKFWASQGISRVVLAREVTLGEIKEIKKNVPEMELEYFVHGAMCMSYSGRCMLSKWMSDKSANLGDCSQPCRWGFSTKYEQDTKLRMENEEKNEIKEMTVVDNRGEFEIDLEEDRQGTYFFNSKDLNLLNYLKDLTEAGVDSFKIEGRNKSVYYLATVVRAYRNVADAILNKDKNLKKIIKKEQESLGDLVHRGYTTGFLLGREPEHNFANSHNQSQFEFVGEVLGIKNEKLKIKNEKQGDKKGDLKDEKLRSLEVKVHNAIYRKDEIEIVRKDGNYPVKILKMFDDQMKEVQSAHGGHGKNYYFLFNKKNISESDLLRKKIG